MIFLILGHDYEFYFTNLRHKFYFIKFMYMKTIKFNGCLNKKES